MCTGPCVQTHVYCPMCTGPCVQTHVYTDPCVQTLLPPLEIFCPMCTGPCVHTHVYRAMCTYPCVQTHVYRPMCTDSCVYRPMCTDPCVQTHVYTDPCVQTLFPPLEIFLFKKSLSSEQNFFLFLLLFIRSFSTLGAYRRTSTNCLENSAVLSKLLTS